MIEGKSKGAARLAGSPEEPRIGEAMGLSGNLIVTGTLAPGDGRDARLQALVARLETYYDFECEGGMLGHCAEWQELKKLALAGEQGAKK